MANRFKDTEIWSEDWYCELGGEYMLFWDFITAKCDHAGVWKPNKSDFEIKTAFKVNLDSFFKKVNGDKQRILLLENGRWFIPGFISFQWFNKKETFDLVLTNRLHKSIYEILLKNNISLKKIRGLKEVLETPKERDKVNGNGFKGDEGVGEGEGFFLNDLPMETELTKVEIISVQEFIEVTCSRKKITESDVKERWKAFKIDNFKKKEWYGSHEKLLSHFRHSLKNELNKNGTHSTSTDRKGSYKGKSAGAYELLDELRSDSSAK